MQTKRTLRLQRVKFRLSDGLRTAVQPSSSQPDKINHVYSHCSVVYNRVLKPKRRFDNASACLSFALNSLLIAYYSLVVYSIRHIV